MLISVNWLRDFVNLPADLDIEALAERFTMTCAEVEGVEKLEVGAKGLIAAKVLSHAELPGSRNLTQVTLDVGGRTVETVSAAPLLRDGVCVIYAPPGARTTKTGDIGETQVAGKVSTGMILPGDAIGIEMAADEAIFCPPTTKPGEPIDPKMLDDSIIEVDNKSITHRPDLWGHYGIAREVAAMLGMALAPYPMAKESELRDVDQPELPIEIDDPTLCPRYSGLRMTGVGFQPSPLWMQTRLGHVGMRPIDCLVDLSNYIMAELGQPTHAFDGDKLDRVEVGLVETGSTFTTLDGVERTLPDDALMILCDRKAVALAGVMGGLETEISEETETILLESANFEPAGIRRCATALGLRTEASARFEKSLDPANTVLAIRRFVHLARDEFPEFQLAGRLSDCFPSPPKQITVTVDADFARRFMGHDVSTDTMISILESIEFEVTRSGETLTVSVPSFRATKDISIEADIIEEIARYVGYDNIAQRLPEVTVRHFEPNVQHRVERDTLRHFCLGSGYCEVHLYLWRDSVWEKRLGIEASPTILVRNPAAADQDRLRNALMPGMLQAVDRNRVHADGFKLCEVGSVYPGGEETKDQLRNVAIVSAARGKNAEDALFTEVKGDIETWAQQVFGVQVSFTRVPAAALPKWANEHKTAAASIGGREVGLVSVVPRSIRMEMDEHLANWGVAWAELNLDACHDLAPDDVRLKRVPEFPEVDIDFSMLVDATVTFGDVNAKLCGFEHDLLKRVSFVDAYEGKQVPTGKRSLTYRCRIGLPDRTLVEDDVAGFRQSFEEHLAACGFDRR